MNIATNLRHLSTCKIIPGASQHWKKTGVDCFGSRTPKLFSEELGRATPQQKVLGKHVAIFLTTNCGNISQNKATITHPPSLQILPAPLTTFVGLFNA